MENIHQIVEIYKKKLIPSSQFNKYLNDFLKKNTIIPYYFFENEDLQQFLLQNAIFQKKSKELLLNLKKVEYFDYVNLKHVQLTKKDYYELLITLIHKEPFCLKNFLENINYKYLRTNDCPFIQDPISRNIILQNFYNQKSYSNFYNVVINLVANGLFFDDEDNSDFIKSMSHFQPVEIYCLLRDTKDPIFFSYIVKNNIIDLTKYYSELCLCLCEYDVENLSYVKNDYFVTIDKYLKFCYVIISNNCSYTFEIEKLLDKNFCNMLMNHFKTNDFIYRLVLELYNSL